MNHNENLLVEAIRNMFDDSAKLGLAYHDEPEERAHQAQFHQEAVENMFRIKANNPKISQYEAITGAFFQTHSYRNIDDPAFTLAFRKQMTGMHVSPDQIDLALKYVDEIRKELKMPEQHSGRRIDTFSDSAEEATSSANVQDLRQATGVETT